MEHLKRLEELLLLLTTHTKLQRFVTDQDRKVLSRRIAGEGATFLSKVLPRMDKYLLKALSASVSSLPNGSTCVTTTSARENISTACTMELSVPQCAESILRSSQPAEKPGGSSVLGLKDQHGCAYPRLLSTAWAAILNEDGSPKPVSEIDVEAVACIRQISHLFYKLEMPYTTSQEKEVTDAFFNAERDLRSFELCTGENTLLLKRAGAIVHRLLGGVSVEDIIPRHGSGSSACGVKPHKRYESFRFIPRLNRVFPYDKYFYFNQTHVVDEMSKMWEAEVCDPSAKVVFVPKDSRGPRLISAEPREFMFIQQGLMKAMYDKVKTLPEVAGQIDFTDQSRNQEYARQSSIDGRYATLDLKEASDRVSLKLVSQLFPDNWVRALLASRSKCTTLPDGTKVPMAKYAPMGSACCFPVEAICFWAISLAAIGVDRDYLNRLFVNKRKFERGHRLRNGDLRISVFGDDLIVPTEHAQSVMGALESVGLIINRDKSFWRGFFRESCGGDYFNGHNVTPIRCKAIPSDEARARHRTSELFNNLIRKYDYENVGVALQLLFEKWYGPVPVSSRYRTSSDQAKTEGGLYLIGPYTDVPTAYRNRFNRKFQRKEYRIPCIVGIDDKVNADSWSHVLRKTCLRLSRIDVSRVALPKRYRIKYRWIEL